MMKEESLHTEVDFRRDHEVEVERDYEMDERNGESPESPEREREGSQNFSLELTMTERLKIGKIFNFSHEEISTLTTASLRADLISLQIRLLDISPFELRTRIEPLFDLDPSLHPTTPGRVKKALVDRRLSFNRPTSSSPGSFILPQSPQTQSIDSVLSSVSSRPMSIELFPPLPPAAVPAHAPGIIQKAEPTPSVSSALSKQQERQLHRKELGLKAEQSWKESGTRTRSLTNPITNKSSANTKPAEEHHPPSRPLSQKLSEKTPTSVTPSRPTRSSSTSSSSTVTAALKKADTATTAAPTSHSNALQIAAQKAVAIFSSRINSKRSHPSTASGSSSGSNSTPQSPHPTKRNSSTTDTTAPKTPLKSSIGTKPKTPTSVNRSSASAVSGVINVPRSNSASSLSQGQGQGLSLRQSVESLSSSVSGKVISTKSGSNNHQFKAKSVAASSAPAIIPPPAFNPPTLRGGGKGILSKGTDSSSMNSTTTSITSIESTNSSLALTNPIKKTMKTKPTIPPANLVQKSTSQTSQSLENSTKQTHLLMSSSISSVKSDESSAVLPVSSSRQLSPPRPAENPFGALIHTPPAK